MSPARLLRQRTVVPLAVLLLAVAETAGAAATSLATIALSALGLLCAVAGIRRHRPEGRLWHVLAGAIAVQGIAVVVWHAHPLLGLPYPGPGVADVGWIVANALLAGTLLYILTGRERPLTVLLDTAAIGAGVGVVVGVAIVGPKLVAGGFSLGQSTIPSAYALVDVVLLSSVLRLLMAPRGGPPALWLLALAASGTVVSDILWNWLTLSGDHVPGAWTDIGWLGLPVLVGLAAMHPSMRVVRRRQNRYDDELRLIGAALLGAAGLVSPLLLGLHDVLPVLPGLDHPGTSGIAVMTTGALVSGLVVTRFAVLLRHARVLADTADAALDERTRLLDDSTARHRRLLDQLPAVVLVYELAAGGELPRPIYVGGQVEQLLGIPAEDWLHRTAETYARIHPDDRAQGRRMLEAAATFHRVLAAEFRFTRPDGTEIWLRAASAVIDEIDGVRALQAILFDVTDVKRAEQERGRLAAELSQHQKLEAVGQLAAGVAHEINTPIQFVGDTVRFLRDGFSDMLALSFVRAELRGAVETGTVGDELLARVRAAEDAADIEYLHERVPAALDRADEGIARVASIVRAMRQFAHTSSTGHAPVDLNDAVHNTLVVAASAYKYVADVETDLADLPQVMCNLSDVNQVLLNLIVNAAQAIEDRVGDSGGRGRIGITSRRERDQVVVSVADTGGGMPPEVAARVFEPFFTTKEVGRGTGQGLPLARTMIVERHGGALTFDTIPGEGTTFHVRLPIEPAAGREALAVAA